MTHHDVATGDRRNVVGLVLLAMHIMASIFTVAPDGGTVKPKVVRTYPWFTYQRLGESFTTCLVAVRTWTSIDLRSLCALAKCSSICTCSRSTPTVQCTPHRSSRPRCRTAMPMLARVTRGTGQKMRRSGQPRNQTVPMLPRIHQNPVVRPFRMRTLLPRHVLTLQAPKVDEVAPVRVRRRRVLHVRQVRDR